MMVFSRRGFVAAAVAAFSLVGGCATAQLPYVFPGEGQLLTVSTRYPSIVMPVAGGAVYIQSPGTGDWQQQSVQGTMVRLTIGRDGHDFGPRYPVEYRVASTVYKFFVAKTAD